MGIQSTYRLISVDPGTDEEILRVDERGVHRLAGGASAPTKGAIASDEEVRVHTVDASSAGVEFAPDAVDAGASSKGRTASASNNVERAESQTLDDLKASGPLPGMQRAIIVVLVLALVAFGVYFVVAHG